MILNVRGVMYTIFHKYQIVTKAALALLILFFSACDSQQTSQIERKLKDTLSQVPGLSDTDEVQKLAVEEYEKLMRIEYRVLDFEIGKSQEDTEAMLRSLGANRWDCFHVEHVTLGLLGERMRFFCKRKPKSYLRLLTKGF